MDNQQEQQPSLTLNEQNGNKNGFTEDKIISVVPAVATQISTRVRIPVREYPKYNFVGKLLGPKGSTLKQLQLDTGTRMSILGRNSMRDKNKEEELRNSGEGKYAHLRMDLHVLIEAYCPAPEAYSRLGHALTEIKKYLTPDPEEYGQQGPVLGVGAPPRGMVRGRGGPPGRGMPRPLVTTAPGGLSASSPRGAPRGGQPRGALRGRGALLSGRGRAAPRLLAAYGQQEAYFDESGYGDPYAAADYEEGSAETYGFGAETGAGGGYEYDSYPAAAGQSASFGQASGTAAGGYGGYGAGGVRQQLKAPPQYSQKLAARAHPYQRY